MATLDALKEHPASQVARPSYEAIRQVTILATELSLEVDVLVKLPIEQVADQLEACRQHLPEDSPLFSRLDAAILLLRQMHTNMHSGCLLEPLNYIDPQAPDTRLTDIHEGTLQQDVAYELGVEYLSPATVQPSFPVRGIIYGNNHRLLTNLIVRHGDLAVNVFFIIDTASPHMFLCTSAMKALGFKEHIPASAMIECQGKIVFAAHSPAAGQFSDVNVLGANFMQSARVRLVADFRTKEVIIDQDV
jgi:hypothetical protein